jgi:hypothetical protein
MTPPPTPWRLRDNPPAAERRAIERRINLLPLMQRDQPGVLDWPTLARRLADELAAMAARLADDPRATESDRERLERARAVVADYRTASREIGP